MVNKLTLDDTQIICLHNFSNRIQDYFSEFDRNRTYTNYVIRSEEKRSKF